MHAAMRATQLIKIDVRPTDIFDYIQYEEAGTTENFFAKAFTKDKAILNEDYAKERIKIKGSRKFIAKTAINSLISYSLIECFVPIDKDDPYFSLAMKEMHDGRKVATLSAIEFAGGRIGNISGAEKLFTNSVAGNKDLLNIQRVELKRKYAAEEELLEAREKGTKKRDRTASTAQAGAASSSQEPKVDEDKEAEVVELTALRRKRRQNQWFIQKNVWPLNNTFVEVYD